MDTPAPNTATSQPSTHPAPRRRMGRWVFILPALLILAGAGLISYPFWPAIGFAFKKPVPTLPYQTNILNVNGGSAALAELRQLPVIGSRPAPSENRLLIPSIGIDMEIIEGPNEKTLDRGGIWRIPNTSTPAQGGNTVVSGHRWQYLPPSNSTLYLLDKVNNGEPVIVYWQGKEYDYRISGREVVDPNRVEILNNTPEPRLTIFTCTPIYSTKQRLVLYGELIS